MRFGSVGGGGRYDGLVARFRAEPVPATGFSIGVSRLLAALRAIDSPIVGRRETPGPVVVLALDRDAESMANYQRLVARLRAAGHRRRTLSRRGRHERAAQIRRQAQQPLRRDPGLERARRAGRPAGRRSATSSSAPNSPRAPRTAPTISSSASAPSSPRPRRSLSSGCARCWRGRERGVQATSAAPRPPPAQKTRRPSPSATNSRKRWAVRSLRPTAKTSLVFACSYVGPACLFSRRNLWSDSRRDEPRLRWLSAFHRPPSSLTVQQGWLSQSSLPNSLLCDPASNKQQQKLSRGKSDVNERFGSIASAVSQRAPFAIKLL